MRAISRCWAWSMLAKPRLEVPLRDPLPWFCPWFRLAMVSVLLSGLLPGLGGVVAATGPASGSAPSRARIESNDIEWMRAIAMRARPATAS
jgi:hypothetical protein